MRFFHISKSTFLLSIVLCINCSISYGQSENTFEKLYLDAVANTRINPAVTKTCIHFMQESENLNEIQKAKINYLKAKLRLENLKTKKESVILTPVFNCENIDSLIQSGIYNIDQGNSSKGLEILYSVLELDSISNTISDSTYTFIQIKIAEGLRINLEFEKAKEILELTLNRENICPYNSSYAYNRLAAIYDVFPELNFEQRVDSVVKYSNLSIAISEKHNYLYLLALSQNELASLYRLKSMNLELSESYAKKAMQNFLKGKMFRNAMNTSIILSDIQIRRKEFIKAMKVCYDVLEYIDIEDNEDVFMRVYLQLAKSHFLVHDYHKAYEFLSIGRLLEKILFEYSMDDKINEMSAKYNLALKESEITKKQHEIELQQKDIQYLIIILIIGFITLIIITLYFFMKRKNLKQRHELGILEKEKLKMMFERKNSELAQSLASNIEKNHVLKRLRKEVDSGKNNIDLVKIINSNIDTSQNWKKVLFDFQNLHPNFIPKLKLNHPDLTQNETRLCALLILKLSSSEIADVLSVSDSAVSKSRQRLRKKLNLDKEADLFGYLTSLI